MLPAPLPVRWRGRGSKERGTPEPWRIPGSCRHHKRRRITQRSPNRRFPVRSLSAIAAATIALLRINSDCRVSHRRLLIKCGRFLRIMTLPSERIRNDLRPACGNRRIHLLVAQAVRSHLNETLHQLLVSAPGVSDANRHSAAECHHPREPCPQKLPLGLSGRTFEIAEGIARQHDSNIYANVRK